MVVTVVVAVLNFLGSLLPQLPTIIDEVRGHPELNDAGKAVLDALGDRIAEHERRAAAAAAAPLPTPPVNR